MTLTTESSNLTRISTWFERPTVSTQNGRPIARHELATLGGTGSERAIDVQINRLRRKIEADPSNPIYLQTVRGKGYILHAE